MRILLEPKDEFVPGRSVSCSSPSSSVLHRNEIFVISSATQGQGLMPDKTVRYRCQGKDVFHFMGCSSFSEYSVVRLSLSIDWRTPPLFFSFRFWKFHCAKSQKMRHSTKFVCSAVVFQPVTVSHRLVPREHMSPFFRRCSEHCQSGKRIPCRRVRFGRRWFSCDYGKE